MGVRSGAMGLCVVAGLAVGGAAAADPGGAEREEAPPVVLWMRGARPGPATSSNLIDHGGPVLPASSAYTIWWGNASAWPNDVVPAIEGLFSELQGSSFLGIAGQYMRGAGVGTAVAASFTDTSSPPTHKPRVSTIVGEACRMITANGHTPDPSAIYFVLTSNFPGGVNYCAWHSYGTCNGATIQVAYMPNTTGIGGCDPGNLGCNGYSQGARSIGNVASHEFMEAITDPTLSAWYDSAGSEIGDKCAWQFQSCVGFTTTSWQLQEEWSNAAAGCVQQ